MDNDGDTASININKYVGADLYGYNLNYFSGDYSPINGNSPFPGVSAKLNSAYRPLYNGNISSMAVNIQPFYASDTNTTYYKPLLYNYSYDQLNRLTGMSAYYGLNQYTNNWDTLTFTPDYKERAAYDPNGNITSYIRYNYGNSPSSPNPMDSLTYNYNSSTNQLNHIQDKAESWIGGYYDIHDMPVNNYAYDQIGNMVKDSIENISGIGWNVYGKITNINHSTTQWYNDALNISYTYDAAGNRISKRITTPGTNTVNYTWYVRDASGNMMATYTGSVDSATGGTDSLQSTSLSLENYYLYGSSRIGQYASHFSVVGDSSAANYYSPWNDLTSYWFRGEKQYELDNHLGNVLVTVSDDKIGVPKSSNSSLIDHYTPVVINAQDYYPFGMLMQGRVITSFYNYYFGFNNQEKDDEVKGPGMSNGAEFWEYDTRSGRRWNLDPKSSIGLSPYATFTNNPILYNDLLGDTVIGVTKQDAEKTVTDIRAILKGDQFAKVRDLIKVGKDKRTLNRIDFGMLNEAVKNQNLNVDEISLLVGIVNTINERSQHKVSYVDNNGVLSSDQEEIFLKGIPEQDLKVIREANNGIPFWLISRGFTGSGGTIPTDNGTYSVFIANVPDDGRTDYFNTETKGYVSAVGGRPAILGHELIGHGHSLALNRTTSQHVDAVQTENLILRVMGYKNIQRDGTNHATRQAIPNSSEIPSFLNFTTLFSYINP